MTKLATSAPANDGRAEPRQRSYLVLNGEVLVTLRGRPIDLVEPGEVVDTRFWPGATYLATLGCKMLPLGTYS